MPKSTTQAVATASYKPKLEEQAVLDKLGDRHRARGPFPRFKVKQTGDAPKLVIDHPDPTTGSLLLMEALGTTSPDFMNTLVSQLVNAGTKGQAADAVGVNFMLAVINGIEPRDEIEALLAAQMAAVHMATMTFARRLNHVDNIPQQDSAERAFNKLMRTFTTQVEALKRYRTGGEQKVVVEHVTVNAGGQAIVGAVETGGRVANRREGQPHAKALSRAIPDASEPPLRGEDQEEREPMPVACDGDRPL